MAVREAERIVGGEKGYVTKEERDAEQFFKSLLGLLLAYGNIRTEE